MQWYNMTYDEIRKIENLETKMKYLKKYKMGLIWFVNPLYDSLTKKQKLEFDEYDKDYNMPIISKIQKLKEIIGGEKAKQIVKKRMEKYNK